MAAPKTDRLRLLQSTGTQLSPVFGLFEDPRLDVHRAFDAVTLRQAPDWEFLWDGEERQQLWVVTDRELTERFTTALADRQIVIADGHHRYETALRYRDERRAAGDSDAMAAWNFVLMGLAAVEDPGLVILPTHRLVRGNPLPTPQLIGGLAHWFDVEAWPLTAGVVSTELDGFLEALAGLGRDFHVLGLHWRDGQLAVLRLRDLDAMERLAPPGRSAAWKRLDVSIAQTLVIQGTLGVSPDEEGRLLYTRDEEFALAAVRQGQAWLALFLNPTRVDDVVAVARAGDVMPEKSTYFYPKLLTGLVFYPLS